MQRCSFKLINEDDIVVDSYALEFESFDQTLLEKAIKLVKPRENWTTLRLQHNEYWMEYDRRDNTSQTGVS
tara:strand:+ start:1888 stop:2100 length:213 start_codon:yes stop_codon:yes gene_type:complete